MTYVTLLSLSRARGPEESGIALLMVLWVLTVLMVIVLSFSYMTRTETQAAVAFQQGVEKKFLAEAGVERAIMEIIYARMNQNIQIIADGNEPWRTDGTPYTVAAGNNHFSVSITDESGKINLNTLTDASGIILKDLLMNSGVQEAEADIIVDSVLDWKDADDLARLHGAESDYYQSLPNPYKAKNANFETPEELLLVRGMTPVILYGDGTKKGIMDFLTVNSKAGQINLKVAPKEVLLAVPGATPELADAIIDSRQDPKDMAAVQAFTASIKPPFNSFIGAGALGDTFSIESSGYKGDEKGGFTIKATVIIDGNNKIRYSYYKGPA